MREEQKSLYKMARQAARERSSAIEEKLLKERVKADSEFDIPAISLKGLNHDYARLSQVHHLQENQVNVQDNWIKKSVKKCLRKINGWYMRPIIERQNEFNLYTVKALDSLVQTVNYLQGNHIYEKLELIEENLNLSGQDLAKRSIFFTCIDNIEKSGRQDEILLIFHYYNKFINPHSHLLILSNWTQSTNYLQGLLAIVGELGIKNVHFIVNPDDVVRSDYLDMTDAFLSLKEDLGDNRSFYGENKLKFLNFACNLENAYDISGMSIEEIAELIRIIFSHQTDSERKVLKNT